MRIGVFGGTFDPIHNAHCELARTALRAARLDKVLFVVSARPPHKGGETHADAEDRYALVCAAITDIPGAEASRLEMERKGPSYTVDTLRAVAKAYPGADLFLIVGYDALLDLPKWYDAAGILRQARVLAARRPGPMQDPPPMLEGRYELLPFQETGVSSTELRQRIRNGAPLEGWVPPAVARLIAEKEMYRDLQPLT